MFAKHSVPNLLTAFRILAIPLLIVVYYLPGEWTHVLAAGLFLITGITDYFDGFLARHWNVQSSLGRFLDPIADKLLVAAVLIVLVDTRLLHGWHILPTLAILCREILVSGLREHLAELRVTVPVTWLAKWKTAVQMVALFFLLLGPVTPDWLGGLWLGLGLLWLSAILTLYTGYAYLREGLRHF